MSYICTMSEQKSEYLHNNPVAAGIVYHQEDYVYSSAVDYAGKKSLLSVSRGGSIKFKNKACEVLKVKEFTKVNDCFQHERNAVIGLYRQTLLNIETYRLKFNGDYGHAEHPRARVPGSIKQLG